MSAASHISALKAKHQQLENQIHYAEQHFLPTADYKKAKLKIKDEIRQLELLLGTHSELPDAA